MFSASLQNIAVELNSTVLHTEKDRVQVFALSDLHADTKRNEDWVKEHCPIEPLDPMVFSVFILPGDVGTEIDRLMNIFQILTSKYDAVVYCVGNHESWRRGTASGGSSLSPEKRTPETNREAPDSVAKIVEVLQCAKV
jgi:predicted MPP superfamily phosphohydrolase